jgi:mono/diheme cytochrome c family protein
MNVGDVADLIAFLRTLPAVPGRAPVDRLRFPFSIRRGVGLWKLLYFDNASLEAVASQSAEWNLGRYLVEGLAHCGECHTPRGWFGQMELSERLAGAPMLDGRGKAPSLVGAELGHWTKADIVEALSSGFTPSGDALGGAMTGVVRNAAQLTQTDREAIAVYLKTLRPVSAEIAKP